MADVKISGLAAASALTGAELVPVVQSSTTVRTTVTLIAQYAANPLSNDGDTLGTSALQWGDLFLASGGVVNWANGNFTITHSSGLLTFSGAVTISGTLTTSAARVDGVQTLTGAGAVNVTTPVTKLITTGANALTMPDGAEGQRKTIVMITDGGDGTLTPTNFGNGTTITFNDVGDAVELVFLSSEWWLVSNNGCTVA